MNFEINENTIQLHGTLTHMLMP